MRKVFHFDSPRENYVCDAALIWCFDNRFELVLHKLLKRMGIGYPDRIRVAGGAKCLASPDSDAEREFVLDQIKKSIRLHGTRRVLLMVHSDCGAYGGLVGAFKGDEEAESRHHYNELQQAADYLRRELPGVAVESYFVNFEGVWDVNAAATAV